MVYLIQGLSRYKIGFTKNNDARERLKQLQTGSPIKLILIAYKKDANHSLEKFLHKKFISKKSHGEWFSLSKDDIYYLVNELGFIQENNILFFNRKKFLQDIKRFHNNLYLLNEYDLYKQVEDIKTKCSFFLTSHYSDELINPKIYSLINILNSFIENPNEIDDYHLIKIISLIQADLVRNA